jgi:hypothetical protein
MAPCMGDVEWIENGRLEGQFPDHFVGRRRGDRKLETA